MTKAMTFGKIKMKKTALMILALLLAAGTARADGLVLKYHETEKITVSTPTQYQHVGQNKKPIMSVSTSSAETDNVVTLLPDFLGIRAGDTESLYNFAKKTYTVIDHAKKSYKVYPLHSIPLYRHYMRDAMIIKGTNFENVTQTGRMIPSMGGYVLDTASIRLDIDALYGSVSDQNSSSLMKFAPTATAKTFTSDSGTAADFTLSTTAVPAELQKTYAHFLLYGPVLHPDVEKAMTSSSKAFDMLDYTIHDHDGRDDEVSWKLAGSEAAAAATKIPDGYVQAYSDNDGVNSSIISAQQAGPTAQNYADRIKGLLNQAEQPVGKRAAVVELNEMNLSLPVVQINTVPNLPDQIIRTADDEFAQKLFLVLSHTQSTKSDIANSDDALKQAKQALPDYVYMLDLFRARNIRVGLALDTPAGAAKDETQMNKSIKMDVNAILANPWLAAAYGDLGDAYFEAGDPMFAWICWEQAVRLKPELPAAARMEALKAKAEKDFPEYF